MVQVLCSDLWNQWSKTLFELHSETRHNPVRSHYIALHTGAGWAELDDGATAISESWVVQTHSHPSGTRALLYGHIVRVWESTMSLGCKTGHSGRQEKRKCFEKKVKIYQVTHKFLIKDTPPTSVYVIYKLCIFRNTCHGRILQMYDREPTFFSPGENYQNIVVNKCVKEKCPVIINLVLTE